MRSLKNLSMAALLALISTGCVIVAEGGGERPIERADLTIFYSFGGYELNSPAACLDKNISTIYVRVSGIDVNHHTVKSLSCRTYSQGITLRGLRVGRYHVSISAKDSEGFTVYSTETPRSVYLRRMGVEIEIDVEAAFGSLTVWWSSFGDRLGRAICGRSGVQDVRAVLYDVYYNVVADDYLECADEGVVWDYLPGGSYEVVLNGLDEYGYPLYAGELWVDVISGRNNSYELGLESIVGDLAISWLINGSDYCGSVSTVRVELYDPWDELYDSAEYPCEYGGLVYPDVYFGEWVVVLEAIGRNGRVLYSSDGAWLVWVDIDEYNEYYFDLY